MKHIAASLIFAGLLGVCGAQAQTHPLDGLTAAEYNRIQEILRAEGTTNDETLFPLIELLEPSKTEVLNWSQSEPLTRKASVQYTSKEGFREAIVDISNGTVENDGPIGETG
ncbi:MAG: tyramine oxidase, partial [Pseudomonadota bacterium]